MKKFYSPSDIDVPVKAPCAPSLQKSRPPNRCLSTATRKSRVLACLAMVLVLAFIGWSHRAGAKVLPNDNLKPESRAMHDKDKAKGYWRDTWENTDRYWTVSYSATEGVISIRVLVYDNEYGPADEDGYLDYAHLQYSTNNGSNYSDFYYIDYDDGPKVRELGSRGGAGASVTTSSGGRNTYVTVRLYGLSSLQDITNIRIVGNWDVNGVYGSDDLNASRTVSIPKLGSLSINKYTFTEDGKVKLDWTSNDNATSRQSITTLDLGATPVSATSKGTTSGTFTVSQNAKAMDYRLHQYHSNNSSYLSIYSSYFTVPAFTHPTGIKAIYNAETDKVDITWTMPKASGSNIEKSDFKLQRATKADFTDAVDVEGFSTNQSRKYDPDKTSYTFSDNPHANVYYRIARDLNQQGWGWSLGKSTFFDAVHAAFKDSSHVALTLDSEKVQALLTWDVEGIWTNGATFTITRVNRTGSSSIDIQLDKEDYMMGQYIDSLITPCNEYYYTLQIKPAANSGFETYKPYITTNSILPVRIGTIQNLTASKGYFPDRTLLKWSSQGSFDNYLIKRRVYGSSDNFSQIASVPGANISDVQMEDNRGTPGVYYQYMVVGAVNCNNETKYSKDTLYAIGFRAPTGNIYGRVTYANGQAVNDVAVRLESQDDTRLGQSIYLNGTAESYLKLDSLQTPFTDSAFTLQVWIRPDDASPKSQVIFSQQGQYELGFDGSGKLYFSYNGSSVTGDYKNDNQSYVHVTGIHSKDTLSIMLNDSVIAKVANANSATGSVSKTVYIGRNAAGNYFKGYIDEMSAWNTALTEAQIARLYTCLLTGGENGLAAYWRFDETIVNQFYDLAHHGDKYNQNDGYMHEAHVKHSDVIPTFAQLALKAYTDSTGNYMISGIPYSGNNGTTYRIVPLLGTHQFDPLAVNRLVSEGSFSFAVDFTDKSSFPVSGYVYYRNSTVPATGVQFKTDGQYAQKNNGEIIETDASGKFEIFVPVGTHEVKAVKSNHVFVNDGKITNRFGENLNYQEPVRERILYDSTTVRFIGRVAGGAIQEAFPLGHSLSDNNLGKELSIALMLPSGNKYEINHSGKDSLVKADHLLPSNQTDSSKIHYTRTVYKENEIVVYPDSLTGEFVVDLIPEKFLVNTVTATGWGDLLEGKPVTLDLSNKFSYLYAVNSYQDSAQNNAGDWVYHNYTDTVSYNDSYQFIKRVTPSVSIVQADNSGKSLAYFGDSIYRYQSFVGTVDEIPVLDNAKTGKDKYLFGRPVFSQNKLYHFKINAFESYPFYESVKTDGTPVVAQQGGKDRIDQVPTQDGFVSIYNSLRDGPATADTLSLDDNGQAGYDFAAGDPDLAAKGIKDFAATVRFGQATNINWTWLGDPQLQAYVVGGKLSGTDFVTAGPNKLIKILRDPPGSKSYSYMESGSTISSSKTYTGSFDQVGDESLVQKLGAELVTFTGIGVGTINSAVTSTGIGLGIHHEEHYTHTNTKSETTTLTTKFQTSDDPALVGAAGDLYVGYSTNITYGQSNNITIIPRAEKKPTDSLLYEVSPTSPYLVVQRSGINIGQSFGTLFAFPQRHIIKILIPNLINIRNTLLLPKGTPDNQAQLAANNSKTAVYVSKLPASDPGFGKSNNDTVYFGKDVRSLPFDDGKSYKIFFPDSSFYRTDSIMTLNQYVNQWEQKIADNERSKLFARLFQNYSFHAGNPIEYSEQVSYDTVTNNAFNIIISGSITNSTDVKIFGNGFSFTFNESVGTSQGGEFGETNSSSVTQGFVLASEGTDDYLSVDVNKVGDEGFTFYTKGGVTGCPYEGAERTEYYLPGTSLGEPTARAEVPKLSVDKPVVNDIPSSRKASYTLYLRNESEAHYPASFLLTYGDVDSVKGATIAVDGTAIGGNGRVVVVPYGETVAKVLTLTKGPDAMDYDNIPIILRSSCQYDPTGYQEMIADTVFISAHFVPSCSDINIKQPVENWILNTGAPVNSQGQRYIPVTLNDFDVTNKLFDHIELQYKSSAESQWKTLMKYYADSARMNAAQGEKQFITNAAEINYNLVMDDATFNDQQYDIRAESVCLLGPGEFITTPSKVASGLKDTYNPRLFGNPQPPGGVLGVADEIRLNFNETIADGLLTHANFKVTGIRNGARGDHSVSVRLNGNGDYLATEFDKNLSGKNLTVELWVLPDGKANGTIFSQGNINQSMEVAFTADNHLQLTVGQKTVQSDKVLDYKPGEWAHVALTYDAAAGKVSAFYNFKEVVHEVEVGNYNGIGHFEFGRSIKDQGNFFAGKMHEARVWTDIRSATQQQINSLTRMSGAENGLLAYYPMDEGKGDVAMDKAHGSHARLTGEWSTPSGKAIQMAGSGYLKLSTAISPITPDMDYTMELWFRGTKGQTDATLASNGKGDGTDPGPGGSRDLFFLGFENGLLTFANNGTKVQADGDYLDNNWHHIAIAVNRNSGAARLLVDGELKKYFNAKDLGGIASAFVYLGARAWYDKDNAVTPHIDRYFNGGVDEFRLWNTYMDQVLINKNNNVRLNGDELGLMMYYPMEKYFDFQNNKEMGYTLSDQKIQPDPKVVVAEAVAVNAVESDNMAPIKDRGPVDNLQFDFVVNNDALIINMLEPRQAIDKTIVTFQVDKVRDKHGNAIVSPITWSAYIDQNLLKWSDNELNLTKKVYEGMTFESYVVNNGGNIENFRLDNLSPWLTAYPSSGKIDPKGKQQIIFTINKGLNIGNYDEIIYMRNDNDESEALTLNLKVRGEMPDWKVNPADFKYSMSILGKIRVNHIFSNDKEDVIAAFLDGKCVGVAGNTYVEKNDLWLTFLTVYGDSMQAGNLEFRIWDASEGKIYQGITPSPIDFRNDMVLGTSREPVIFDGMEMLFRDLNLTKGWNWISFGLASPGIGNINSTLAKGNWYSGDMVKNEEMGFDQYSSREGWIGTLKGFNNTSLFMLKTATAQVLSTSGTLLGLKETPITVKGGRWSYISYLPQVNMTVTEALAGYEASDEDLIKSQTGFAIYDSQNGWVGNLTYLEPGSGYMLYRKNSTDTKFTYPVITGSLNILRLAGNSRGESLRLNPYQSPVENNFIYANNMTVLASVAKGFTLLAGDKLLAYSGNVVKGEALPVTNPRTKAKAFFFVISGDNNEPVHFEVIRNGKTIARTEILMHYRSNSISGTLKAPVMLDFSKEFITTAIYPNPFRDVVNLRVKLSPGVHEIQVAVYDANGKPVITYPKESVSGESYQLRWNGNTSGGGQCTAGVYFIHLSVDGKPNVYKVIKL